MTLDVWACGVYRAGDLSVHTPCLLDRGLAETSMDTATELYSEMTQQIITEGGGSASSGHRSCGSSGAVFPAKRTEFLLEARVLKIDA